MDFFELFTCNIICNQKKGLMNFSSVQNTCVQRAEMLKGYTFQSHIKNKLEA